MIKYLDTAVVFEEVPDEVTLAIEITNCPGHCVGCHSPWLREDIGEELTIDVLHDLIDKNKGITCVCFMGEGKDPETLKLLASTIKFRNDFPYKVALYSGRYEVEDDFYKYFDYIKLGPYIPEFGPLNNKETNQRLYEIVPRGNGLQPERVDITYKFWRDGEGL